MLSRVLTWLVFASADALNVPPSCDGCSRRKFATAATAAALTSPTVAQAARPPPPPEPVTDRNGAAVTEAKWLASHSSDTPDLVLGLDGEPHFLLLTAAAVDSEGDEDRVVRPYALRAECTHLGCLVQPDLLTGGFACPCHGSKYAADGSVTRGPAPSPLKLARVESNENGQLTMSKWLDEDFRTGGA